MARNHEKNYGRLNRLWLAEKEGKKEKRPKLSSLKTAEDVSQWLPSIKEELDFFLKQIEVPCYTENKIKECRKHIMHLEAEYKAFVRRLHQLDTKRRTTPWTARPYEKKEKCSTHHLILHPLSEESKLIHLSPLQTPVLTNDALYQGVGDDETKSAPLLDDNCTSPDTPLFESDMISSLSSETRGAILTSKTSGQTSHLQCISESEGMLKENSNLLGLDYSSSEDE